ncbi:MAG: ATP-dependent nuclease [Promethearchaeota archaeon]
MFVETLDIKEFRGIKDCKKKIELSEFTILIGKNNSGKTSVLEALSLLPHVEVKDKLFNKSKISVLKELHSSRNIFYRYSGQFNLTYFINNEPILLTCNEKFHFTVKFRKKAITPQELARQLSHSFNKKDNEMVQFLPFNQITIQQLQTKLNQLKDKLTKKGLHITLAKFLNKCVNDKFSELVFLQPVSLRKIYADNTFYLELKDLGSGAEKVILTMAFLEIMDPLLVLIDDFEAGLHPSLLKSFLKWLNEKKFQKIISTHSIDVLYHLTEIHPKNSTILLLDKSNEDILCYKKLTIDELEDIINANHDPRLLPNVLEI